MESTRAELRALVAEVDEKEKRLAAAREKKRREDAGEEAMEEGELKEVEVLCSIMKLNWNELQ